MNFTSNQVKSAIDSLPEDEREFVHWLNNPEMQAEREEEKNVHEKIVAQDFTTQKA